MFRWSTALVLGLLLAHVLYRGMWFWGLMGCKPDPVLTLRISSPSSDSVIPLAVATGVRGPGAVDIDVDLNHDGRFEGAGEVGYAHALVSGEGVIRLHGLIHGRYQVRARATFSGSREVTSAVCGVEILPPPPSRLPVSFEANHGQADSSVLFLGRARNQMVFIAMAETALVTVCQSLGHAHDQCGISLPIYPEGVASKSPGSRSAPWVEPGLSTLPRRGCIGGHGADALLCNPFDVELAFTSPNPGCASRPWAFGCNPFGVKTQGSDAGCITHRKTPAPHAQIQRFRLVGADPHARPMGQHKLPGACNYFIGNEPDKWRTDIETYQEIVTAGVYPGIDLVYHSNQGRLEYDFRVAPGADPSVIALDFPDAGDLSIDADGCLVIQQAHGPPLRKLAPMAYQYRSGQLEAVKSDWVLKGSRRASFVVSQYDAARELVIDPILFSTFLGGNMDETVQAAAVDAAGNIYITGFTLSANFPVQGPFQATLNAQDLFVSKINAAGTALVYSTFLGGSLADGWISGKQGIAVDSTGSAVITAGTPSTNFPMMNPAQGVYGGNMFDAIVTKLNAIGNALVFSTYLGGNDWDLGYGLTVDATNAVYVTGLTASTNFPTTAGVLQTTRAAGNDGFVTKYTPAGVVVYSTYLGGNGTNEWGRAVAVSGTNAYVMGVTDSTNFPTTVGAFRTANAGGWDVFVTQLDAAAATMVYSTYAGGAANEDGWGVVLDTAGNAYLACRTDSANFPVTPGAAQPTFGGGTTDGAVLKLNATGSAAVYSTFLGGSAVDEVRAIAINAGGNAFVTGFTLSGNFPTVNAIQPSFSGGGGDAFVTMVNPAGTALVFSSYLGGSGPDGGAGIGLDTSGAIWVAGNTNSANFPMVTPLQATIGGASDAFVVRCTPGAPPSPPPPPTPPGGPDSGAEGSFPGSKGPAGDEGSFGFGGRGLKGGYPVLWGPFADKSGSPHFRVFNISHRRVFSLNIAPAVP